MCFWDLQYLGGFLPLLLCGGFKFTTFRVASSRCGALVGTILCIPLHAGAADWLSSSSQFASYFTSCWGWLKWVLIKSCTWIASLQSALLIMNWSLWREILVNTVSFRKLLLALDSFTLWAYHAYRTCIWKWCGFLMAFASTIAGLVDVLVSPAFGSREIHNIQQGLARNS